MNKKRIIIIASLILCVCILLTFGTVSFVKSGKKILSVQKGELVAVKTQEGLAFESLKQKDIYISYNTTTGKYTKIKKQVGECLSVEQLSKYGDYGMLAEYKLTLDKNKLFYENTVNGESKTVLEAGNSEALYYNELDVYYELSDFKAVARTLYFSLKREYKQTADAAETLTKNYLCVFSLNEKDLKMYEAEAIDYSNISINRVFFSNGKSVRVYDNSIKEATKLFDFSLKEGYSFVDVFADSQGIVVISKASDKKYLSEFCLYSFNGENIKSIELNGDVVSDIATDVFCNMYFFAKNENGVSLQKVASQLLENTVLCQNAIPKQYNKKKDLVFDNLTLQGEDFYYTATVNSKNDDSFSFCSIDKQGKQKTIYKEGKTFLRNFFKL